MTDLLKSVAFISMVIDHWSRLHGYNVMTALLGRLAFPFFAYFIGAGVNRTNDAQKYVHRLLILGYASQAPYVLFLGATDLNICFTLAAGAILLAVEQKKIDLFYICIVPICIETSGGPAAVLLIYSFGKKWDISAFMLLLYMAQNDIIFLIGYIVSFVILITCRHSKIGPRFLPRWFFYVAYPLHFSIL